MSGREEITIRIDACVFGGRFVVSTEPRAIDRPSSEFRVYAEARACADAMSAVHGWPIDDHTSDAGQ